jgi:hypothetical protein
VAFVLALLALGQFASAATGDLRVSVTDGAGLPVRAAVEVVGGATQIRERSETAPDGRIVVRRLPFGMYRVTASAPGFGAMVQTIEIKSATPPEITFALAIAMEESVTVQASADLLDPHRAGTVQRIGAARIDERSTTAAGRAVIELINDEPGWLLEANGVLHPRGSEYDTQYVVDGLPLTDNRSPAFAPALGEGSIVSLGVLTGGFPAEYGRKLGGVIEVVTGGATRRGVHGQVSASIASSSTGAGEAVAGYTGDGASAVVSGGASTTDRYLDPPVPENYTNQGESAHAAARLEGGLLGGRAGVIARHGRSDFLVPNELVQQEAGQEQSRSNRENAAQFSYRYVLGGATVAEAVAMVRRVSVDLSSNARSTPLIAAQSRSSSQAYVKATIAASRGVHEIKAGGDFDATTLDERFAYDITEPGAFDDEVPAAFEFADKADGREYALFLQDQVRAGDWTINAGIRWDRYNLLVRESAWSPRIAIARAFAGRGLVARASYDRIFQTPASENLLLASSDRTDELGGEVVRLPVPPSRGHFFEAGLSKQVFSRARVDVNGFLRRLDNFGDDDVVLNTGVSVPVAFRRATVGGMEAKLDVRDAGPWSASVGYALSRGEGEGPITGGLLLDAAAEEPGTFPISQDQRHTLRARVRFASSRWWTAGAVSYGSGLPFEFEGTIDEALEQYGPEIVARVDFGSGRVRPSFALDLSGGFRVWEREGRSVRVLGEIRNLSNRFDVVNFAGLFSGTAVAPPRRGGVRLSIVF